MESEEWFARLEECVEYCKSHPDSVNEHDILPFFMAMTVRSIMNTYGLEKVIICILYGDFNGRVVEYGRDIWHVDKKIMWETYESFERFQKILEDTNYIQKYWTTIGTATFGILDMAWWPQVKNEVF